MNRYYKFRVWDKEKSIILKDFEVDQFCESGTYLNHVFKYDNRFIFNQFIGLLDKNRQEIYEGDIVRFYLSNYQGKLSKEEIGEIKYSETLAHYYISVPNESYKPEHYLIREANDIEVIGNKFETGKITKYDGYCG